MFDCSKSKSDKLICMQSETQLSIAVRVYRVCLQPLGLLKQSPNQPASHPYPASSVSPKCSSKAHLQPETLRPHHWCAHQPPLAPRARANYIQGGDADVPCTPRLCTTITWRRHSHVSPTCCTDAGSGPPPQIGLTFQLAVCKQSGIVLFLLLVQRYGTAWQAMWHQLRRWRCSRTGSRRTCSTADMKMFD